MSGILFEFSVSIHNIFVGVIIVGIIVFCNQLCGQIAENTAFIIRLNEKVSVFEPLFGMRIIKNNASGQSPLRLVTVKFYVKTVSYRIVEIQRKLHFAGTDVGIAAFFFCYGFVIFQSETVHSVRAQKIRIHTKNQMLADFFQKVSAKGKIAERTGFKIEFQFLRLRQKSIKRLDTKDCTCGKKFSRF